MRLAVLLSLVAGVLGTLPLLTNATLMLSAATASSEQPLSSELSGLSCPSGTSCFAVGSRFYKSAGAGGAFAEHWDGTSWSVQSIPTPSGSTGTQLNALSCPTTTSCV